MKTEILALTLARIVKHFMRHVSIMEESEFYSSFFSAAFNYLCFIILQLQILLALTKTELSYPGHVHGILRTGSYSVKEVSFFLGTTIFIDSFDSLCLLKVFLFR